MREDCRHFESRIYDSGEVARFCVLGLAPEAPWRCPDACPRYEPSLIDGTFESAELSRPPVEDEPEAAPDDVEGVLADAESIVEHAEAGALREVAGPPRPRGRWWRRGRRPPDDGESRLGNR